MNPASALSLILDLYEQISALQAELEQLRKSADADSK
jgi:hypothetical protein